MSFSFPVQSGFLVDSRPPFLIKFFEGTEFKPDIFFSISASGICFKNFFLADLFVDLFNPFFFSTAFVENRWHSSSEPHLSEESEKLLSSSQWKLSEWELLLLIDLLFVSFSLILLFFSLILLPLFVDLLSFLLFLLLMPFSLACVHC